VARRRSHLGRARGVEKEGAILREGGREEGREGGRKGGREGERREGGKEGQCSMMIPEV
jgi:hypothetical protein